MQERVRGFNFNMKWKKKPVIIEAEQYTGTERPMAKGVCTCNDENGRPHVHTMHNGQTVILKEGDWIIPEPNGINYYPCDNEVFRNTYDKAEE